MQPTGLRMRYLDHKALSLQLISVTQATSPSFTMHSRHLAHATEM